MYILRDFLNCRRVWATAQAFRPLLSPATRCAHMGDEALRVSLIAGCIERHQNYIRNRTIALRHSTGGFDRGRFRRDIQRSKAALRRLNPLLLPPAERKGGLEEEPPYPPDDDEARPGPDVRRATSKKRQRRRPRSSSAAPPSAVAPRPHTPRPT